MDENDVIVWISDKDHVSVQPPKESDSQAVFGTKVFLLACLHRLVNDEDFAEEMSEWSENLPDKLRTSEGIRVITRN